MIIGLLRFTFTSSAGLEMPAFGALSESRPWGSPPPASEASGGEGLGVGGALQSEPGGPHRTPRQAPPPPPPPVCPWRRPSGPLRACVSHPSPPHPRRPPPTPHRTRPVRD